MKSSAEKLLRDKLETVSQQYRAYHAAYNVLFNNAPFEALLLITHNRLEDVSRQESETYLETLNSLLPLVDRPTQEQRSLIFCQNFRLNGWENALKFALEEAAYLEQIEIRLLDFEDRLKRDAPAMKPTTSVYNYAVGHTEGLRYCLSIMNAE